MKKVMFILILGSCLVFTLPAAEGMPRILIAPLKKQFESEQYNVIATTMYDTILLSLRLLGEYEIVTLEDEIPDFSDTETVSQYAAENFIDNIVSGSMSVDENGGIDFFLQLYEQESDTVKAELHSPAANVLEVFDASDLLITDLIAQFNDRHIAFGSMVFTNNGYDGDYDIFLGNAFLGLNVEKAERVLIGEYELIIAQQRFNDYKVLDTRTVTIIENEEIDLNFSIPHLLPEEELLLDARYEELVLLLEQKGENNRSPEILNNVFSEMNALPGMEGLELYIPRFRERETLWKLKTEWWDMEESLLTYPPENFVYAPVIYNDDSPWIDTEIKEAARMNGILYCHILSLQASLLLGSEDLESGMALYEMILSMGRQFDSDTAFGFLGEYEQLKEILDHPKRRERWKEKNIGRLVELREELALELSLEDKVTTLLVYLDAQDMKARVNGRRRRFPYIDSRYRQEKLSLTLMPKKEEKVKLEFPVFGINTVVLIPEDDPAYRRELKPKRDFQRFSAYFGLGGGSWIGARGQYRFAWGYLGISAGMEYAMYFPGDAVESYLTIPIQMDLFLTMQPRWESSMGFLFDLIALGPDGVIDVPSPGINIGIVMKWDLLDFYLDNRFYFISEVSNTDILYSPQIGIRL